MDTIKVSEPTLKELADAAPQVGFNKFQISEHTFARYPTTVSKDGRVTKILYDQEPEIFTE